MTATALGALAIILAGAGIRRLGVLGPEDGPVLVRIVLYLALPPLVFLILIRADLETALVLVPVAGFAIHGIMLGLAWASTRAWRVERPRAGALIVVTAVGNTGFFGLPLIAASGDGFSLPAAAVFDALATGIITWTSTPAISAAYGRADAGAGLDWGEIRRALMLPPMWALVAGLALNLAGVDDLPRVVERPLELLGAAVLPLVMIYAGLLVETRGLARVWREAAYVAVMRLGVAALVGVLVARALGLEGEIFNTVVIMSAMPAAMMSLVIGSSYGLRSDVLVAAVVVTTLLSTLTLPLIRAVLL